MRAMRLKVRRFIGFIARFFYPGFSTCGRCSRPWPVCTGHDTPITQNSSCFPLCEDCWQELTVENRLPYYAALFRDWQRFSDDDNGESWAKVKENVLAGK